MKVNSFKRLACVLLACLMCFGIFGTPTSAASGSTGASAAALEEAKQYLNSDTYATYLATYLNAGVGAGDIRYEAVFNAKASDDSAYVISDSAWADEETGYGTVENYRAGAVYSPGNGSVVFTVDVATTGMYYIMVEYYTLGETVNAIERKLYIDGELPFKEASLLSLSKIWEYQYNDKNGDDGFDEDLNGNSLTPSILQKSDWRTYFCHDADGYSNEYFNIYFSEGTHEVEFRGIRESMVIGSVTLVPVNDSECGVLSYAEYLAYVTGTLGATNAPAGTKVLFQAEKPVFVSDSSVVMSGNKTSAINQPTSPSCDLYNVIGATSYNAVGQWAAYSFTVPETGLYNFTLRYLQNTLDGVFVSRAIKLTSHGQGSFVYGLADGTPTVPFQEAYSSRYVYSDDWMVDRAGDAGNDFKFYFEKGVTYTVYFEVSLGALAGQLQRVENVLSILNSAYLEILKLTGPNPDEYSNYNFFALLPDLKYDLSFAAVELDDIRQELEDICGEGTGAHLANLENIIRLVSTMAESEFEIAGNFANLKSYLGTLGTWISDSKKSTLIVDFITVQSPDTSLEKANANFFQTVWYEIRAFFASFFAAFLSFAAGFT